MPRHLVASAPSRLDFGGGWTDVPPYPEDRGGFVCNVAIERRAVVRATWNGASPASPGRATRAPGDASAIAAAPDLPLVAAARRVAPRWWDAPFPPSLRLALTSDFPVGAGLGGSSAAGVAVAAALAAATHHAAGDARSDRDGEPPPRSMPAIGTATWRAQLAECSRAAEVEELGVAGGRQDHYAAAFGGALGLTFGETVDVAPLPLDATAIADLESRLIVAYTGASRMSGETISAVLDAYAERVPRVLHALAAMATLARRMAHAIDTRAFDELAVLVDEHWAHQRALHPAITTDTVDAVLAAGRRAGATGGKALGASGGGCVLLLAPPDRADAVRRAVGALVELLPVRIAREGVRVDLVHPGDDPA